MRLPATIRGSFSGTARPSRSRWPTSPS
jgi:hypothetical protein